MLEASQALEHNRRVYATLVRPAWKSRLMYDLVSKRNLAREALRRSGQRPSGWRIFDLGFGDGLTILSMPRDNHVAGVEIVPEYVERAAAAAKRKGFASADFRWSDGVVPVPFPAMSFDLVVCSHVLEHVPDDQPVLVDLVRLLKPGGLALLVVPIHEERIDDPNHVRRYDPAGFLNFVSSHGLEPVWSGEADRTWDLIGWFFIRGWHDRGWGLGFLASSVINIVLSRIPFRVLSWFERLYPASVRTRQLAVVARRP
jgi:SAM-dependent methyltransferase